MHLHSKSLINRGSRQSDFLSTTLTYFDESSLLNRDSIKNQQDFKLRYKRWQRTYLQHQLRDIISKLPQAKDGQSAFQATPTKQPTFKTQKSQDYSQTFERARSILENRRKEVQNNQKSRPVTSENGMRNSAARQRAKYMFQNQKSLQSTGNNTTSNWNTNLQSMSFVDQTTGLSSFEVPPQSQEQEKVVLFSKSPFIKKDQTVFNFHSRKSSVPDVSKQTQQIIKKQVTQTQPSTRGRELTFVQQKEFSFYKSSTVKESREQSKEQHFDHILSESFKNKQQHEALKSQVKEILEEFNTKTKTKSQNSALSFLKDVVQEKRQKFLNRMRLLQRDIKPVLQKRNHSQMYQTFHQQNDRVNKSIQSTYETQPSQEQGSPYTMNIDNSIFDVNLKMEKALSTEDQDSQQSKRKVVAFNSRHNQSQESERSIHQLQQTQIEEEGGTQRNFIQAKYNQTTLQ